MPLLQLQERGGWVRAISATRRPSRDPAGPPPLYFTKPAIVVVAVSEAGAGLAFSRLQSNVPRQALRNFARCYIGKPVIFWPFWPFWSFWSILVKITFWHFWPKWPKWPKLAILAGLVRSEHKGRLILGALAGPARSEGSGQALIFGHF